MAQHFLVSAVVTAAAGGTERPGLVGRAGGFAAVDGGFGAPLATEEGEGFEDGFGEAEEVNENGVVKGLAGGIAVGLVGGEEFVVAEVGEDAVGPVDLVLAELAYVECW